MSLMKNLKDFVQELMFNKNICSFFEGELLKKNF